MIYKYTAYSNENKVVEGKLDVASESLAEEALYHAGVQNIISLEEVLPGGVDIGKFMPKLSNVKTRDIIDTSNQLATLIQSGITILAALKLLEGQTTNKALKKVFVGLAEQIQAGNSLSQALISYPRTFPDTYCQIIRASEQAGTMETGFKQAASFLEKQARATQKIRRAMLYPSFVLILAIGVGILLVTIALPPLINLFTSLDVELPWMTSLLVSISTFLTNNGLVLLLVIFIGIIFMFILFRMPSIKLVRDKLLLRIPMIGKIIVERNIGLFCQTVSMLLQAGLRLPQILDMVIQTTHNQHIRNSMVGVRERLVQGEGLSQPMADDKLFPPLLVEMTSVGEKTGALDATLGTLADFYEQEVDRKIDSLIAMIEPALTLVIGGVVIFIALSMITPLYSILKSIR